MRILLEVGAYLVFLPFVVGMLKYRYLDVNLKIVWGFVLFCSFIETFADIYQNIWSQNTMPIGNIYITLSVFLLSLFYLKALEGFLNKRVLIGIIILYEMFCVANLIFIQNMYEFPNIQGALGALLLLSFSILLFSKIMLEAKIEKLFKEPVVWVNIGVLICYSVSFFYFTLFNYNLKISTSFAMKTVYINMIGNDLMYVLIAIGFWKTGKQKGVLPKS